MKKGQLQDSTYDWIIAIANQYGFDPETVAGIYREMYSKCHNAKSRTLSFIHLYSEGRNNYGANIESE